MIETKMMYFQEPLDFLRVIGLSEKFTVWSRWIRENIDLEILLLECCTYLLFMKKQVKSDAINWFQAPMIKISVLEKKTSNKSRTCDNFSWNSNKCYMSELKENWLFGICDVIDSLGICIIDSLIISSEHFLFNNTFSFIRLESL